MPDDNLPQKSADELKHYLNITEKQLSSIQGIIGKYFSGCTDSKIDDLVRAFLCTPTLGLFPYGKKCHVIFQSSKKCLEVSLHVLTCSPLSCSLMHSAPMLVESEQMF